MDLTWNTQRHADELLKRLLEPLGVTSCGIVQVPYDRRRPEDPRSVAIGVDRRLTVVHDERGAPVVLGCGSVSSLHHANDDILVSLTDEDGLALCAWALATDAPAVMGLGVDLASTSDFAGSRRCDSDLLLFSRAELELVPELGGEDLELGYAYLFSAKEAAFKALAAPIRRWCRGSGEAGEGLSFDILSFEMADPRHETGTARRGSAQQAMDRLGVGSILLGRTVLQGRALTIAVALGA